MSNRKEKELISIIKKYKDQFTTTNAWDNFAKENRLPSSSVLIKTFGSWNEIKRNLNIPLSKKNHPSYTKEEIIDLGKQYKKYLRTKELWNENAKKSGFPVYETIIKYVSWNELQILSRVEGKYSDEQLIEFAKKYKHHFTSRNKWDKFAKEHSLPYSQVYIRRFKKWNRAKFIVSQYL